MIDHSYFSSITADGAAPRRQKSMSGFKPLMTTKNSKASRVVCRELPELFKLIETRRREVIEKYFGQLLVRGQRVGLLRKDVPARLMTEILLCATEAILNPVKAAELDLITRTGFPAIVSAALQFIITEKGRAKA